jgi:hypothetical protein
MEILWWNCILATFVWGNFKQNCSSCWLIFLMAGVCIPNPGSQKVITLFWGLDKGHQKSQIRWTILIYKPMSGRNSIVWTPVFNGRTVPITCIWTSVTPYSIVLKHPDRVSQITGQDHYIAAGRNFSHLTLYFSTTKAHGGQCYYIWYLGYITVREIQEYYDLPLKHICSFRIMLSADTNRVCETIFNNRCYTKNT